MHHFRSANFDAYEHLSVVTGVVLWVLRRIAILTGMRRDQFYSLRTADKNLPV